MRIAFDHQIFSAQPWGGISRYFVRLAQELDAAGEDVSVMAHFHKNHHLIEASDALVDGRSVIAWHHRLGKLAQGFNNPLLSRSLRRWPPDIFHETYYKGHKRDSLKAPVVVTVYDMIHEIMPEVFRQGDQTPTRKRNAVRQADHVICISEHTRQDLLRFVDIDPAKTSVVHLGVDLPAKSNWYPSVSSIDANKRPMVLYVGQRGGYKNFSLLLRALAQSSTLHHEVDIVCFGGGALTAQELSMANELGFRPDQLKHDAGDDQKLNRLYQQAHVFVHTSLYEGFGLPPLEAMAQGCPVVSSNASCMPEVLGEAAHFFDPESIEQLRDALEAVAESAERRKALTKAGYEHCETLSWARCAQNTLQVYESVLQ